MESEEEARKILTDLSHEVWREKGALRLT